MCVKLIDSMKVYAHPCFLCNRSHTDYCLYIVSPDRITVGDVATYFHLSCFETHSGITFDEFVRKHNEGYVGSIDEDTWNDFMGSSYPYKTK